MKLTFNKEDWTGEEATINVNLKTRSWSQNDYRFSLRLIQDTIVENPDGSRLGRYQSFEIRGEGWDFPLGKVQRQEGLEETFEACDGTCSRRNADVFIAASQLLFNII